MEINKKGMSRIVILIPQLGIVLKIARIDFFRSLKNIFKIIGLISDRNYETGRSKILQWFIDRKYYFKWGFIGPVDTFHVEPSLTYLLFRGIWANLSEFVFYVLNIGNGFLVPTYFSLFGIINIQPLQKDVCNKDDKVFGHLCRFTEFNELFKHHAHTFAERSNFCVDKEGKLRILDYASKGAQKMTKKYGKQFHSKLERAG